MQSYNATSLELSETNQNSPETSYSNIPISETVGESSDFTPFVRYGKKTDDGVRQSSQLHTQYEPIPEDAKVVSPVYLLTSEQVARYDDLKDTPFATTGSRNIVFELQEECEQHGRVLYPIVLESDAMDDNVQPEVMKEWLIQFVSQELSISPYDCAWFFSGGRSVHCHAPLFIHGEAHREAFKQKVERFNEEAETELDTGIYDPKQTFRIPGVRHETTGERKTPIGVDDSKAEICQAIVNSDTQKPDTYAELVESVFGSSLQSRSTLPIWSPVTPEKKGQRLSA